VAFRLRFTQAAREALDAVAKDATRQKKLRSCLARLEDDPRHPGLRSDRYVGIKGPDGAVVWESYVENRAPQAWRVWWRYGPDPGVITVLFIGAHDAGPT
jgi:hypothetical protein